MKYLPVFVALALCVPTRADEKVTALVTVTNPAGTTNGQTITVNGNTRTWTNSVTAPTTQILTNNTIGGAATNLFNHASTYPWATLALSRSGTNAIQLVAPSAAVLTVTISDGWGTVGYSTQVVSSMIGVRVPIAGEPTDYQRTNIGSLLVKGASDYSTNSLAIGSTALSNAVQLAGNQSVAGTKTLSALIAVNPVLTNGVNYGNAFRSPGSGANSEQFGTSAAASGDQSVALGNTSTASGNNSIAVGSSANATAESAISLGVDASSVAQGGIAIGANASVSATHTNSVAIGNAATTSAKEQIMLGLDQTVIVPGTFSVLGAISNVNYIGTNNYPAGSDVAYGRYANSSLANGNNAGIVVGTNVFMAVSGPSGAFSINGIANGRNGKLIYIINLTGQVLTIVHDSGVDPVAANRIYTSTGADLVSTGNSFATLLYDATTARWLVIGWEP